MQRCGDFSISESEFFCREADTRFPFRYGIASMTRVPHLFMRMEISDGTCRGFGLAAEGLPPKWFTKDPMTSYEEDLVVMGRVIRHAAYVATELARKPISFFDFWSNLQRTQTHWAIKEKVPPLLASLGVSLCERAILDGLTRLWKQPVHRLIRNNVLGLRLEEIHPALKGASPRDFLPQTPLARLHVRHTVGLTDPLIPADILSEERVEDGFPHDLESSIRAYDLRYFKIKLSGNPEVDRERLGRIYRLLDAETRGQWLATLDGNENFADFEAFRAFWEILMGDSRLSNLRNHILVVEQPVHRDHALGSETKRQLHGWKDRPAFIIDESDGEIGDLPRALDCGYSGTSHKNCKGIVKGLANACLLKALPTGPGILTGEDLCNLGPVALQQDLAMMALLGINHVERNGHHYYRGLSMWSEQWQASVLDAHPDLYQRHPSGVASLAITDGSIQIDSVNCAPFGLQAELDPDRMGKASGRSIDAKLREGLGLMSHDTTKSFV